MLKRLAAAATVFLFSSARRDLACFDVLPSEQGLLAKRRLRAMRGSEDGFEITAFAFFASIPLHFLAQDRPSAKQPKQPSSSPKVCV